MKRVVVINPNSTDRITAQIELAVRGVGGAEFEVATSQRGPAAIETDNDVADSVAPMLATAAAHPADAYIVACFSDPGLRELRELSGVPCFGIAESAMVLATSDGAKVGVISSVDASIPRHDRYWEQLALGESVVGDEAVGLGVLELETPEAYERVRNAGRRLVDMGAATLILGCTGMTHMQLPLADELGVTVIDPCQAAAEAAAEALYPVDSP